MTKTILLTTVGALAISAGVAFAGGVHPSLSVRQTSTSRPLVLPHNGLKILYNQRDNDNGIGIVSQNFESSFDVYDAVGADDFKVKKGVELHIKEVDADGVYFNGSGPAESYDVTFYKNASGKPGEVVDDCHDALYTDTGFGSPAIKCKVSLKKGSYFVSVQANLNFSSGGEWGWNTNNTVRGGASQWQNPGDGFATGCTSWGDTTTCIPSGEGGDFSFALLGKKGD